MKKPMSLEGSIQFSTCADVTEVMIEEIIDKKPKPSKVNHRFFSRKPRKWFEMMAILNLNDLLNFIRIDAEGYPKAFIDLHGHRVEFKQAKLENDKLVGTFEVCSKHKKLW